MNSNNNNKVGLIVGLIVAFAIIVVLLGKRTTKNRNKIGFIVGIVALFVMFARRYMRLKRATTAPRFDGQQTAPLSNDPQAGVLVSNRLIEMIDSDVPIIGYIELKLASKSSSLASSSSSTSFTTIKQTMPPTSNYASCIVFFGANRFLQL